MIRRFTILSMAAMLPLLAACNDAEEAPAPTDGAAAQGEVLPGSIDDAMIPLDQLQSQGPRITGDETGDETGKETEGEDGTADEDAAAQDSETSR